MYRFLWKSFCNIFINKECLEVITTYIKHEVKLWSSEGAIFQCWAQCWAMICRVHDRDSLNETLESFGFEYGGKMFFGMSTNQETVGIVILDKVDQSACILSYGSVTPTFVWSHERFRTGRKSHRITLDEILVKPIIDSDNHS